MRGSNNIVIGVRADTSKLKTDLALLTAELSATTRELNSKAKTAYALPDNDPNKKRLISDVDEVSKRHVDLADKIHTLTNRYKEATAANRALNESGTGNVAGGYKEASTHAKSLSETIKGMFGLSRAVDATTAAGHVKNLHSEVKNLGSGLLDVNGAFAKMHRALQGIQDLGTLGHFGKEAFGGVKQVAEGLGATRNTSLGTGFSTDFVATIENLLKETGKEGDGTNPRGALIQWAGAWADEIQNRRIEEREKARQAAQDRIDKAADPEGFAQKQKEKARLDAAGGPEIETFGSRPFKNLNIDPLHYSPGQAGMEQGFSDSLKKLKDMTPRNAAGAARIRAMILGEDDASNWGGAADAIGKERGGIRDITKRYRDAGELPTKDDLSKLDEYQKAMGKLNRETDALKRSAVVSFFPQVSFGVRGAAQGLKIFSDAFNPIIREFGTWLSSHRADIKEFAISSAAGIKAVAADIAGLFRGQKPGTEFVQYLVDGFEKARSTATLFLGALRLVGTGLNAILAPINDIFGLKLSAGWLAAGAILLRISGLWLIIGAGIKIGIALVGSFGAALLNIYKVMVGIRAVSLLAFVNPYTVGAAAVAALLAVLVLGVPKIKEFWNALTGGGGGAAAADSMDDIEKSMAGAGQQAGVMQPRMINVATETKKVSEATKEMGQQASTTFSKFEKMTDAQKIAFAKMSGGQIQLEAGTVKARDASKPSGDAFKPGGLVQNPTIPLNSIQQNPTILLDSIKQNEVFNGGLNKANTAAGRLRGQMADVAASTKRTADAMPTVSRGMQQAGNQAEQFHTKMVNVEAEMNKLRDGSSKVPEKKEGAASTSGQFWGETLLQYDAAQRDRFRQAGAEMADAWASGWSGVKAAFAQNLTGVLDDLGKLTKAALDAATSIAQALGLSAKATGAPAASWGAMGEAMTGQSTLGGGKLPGDAAYAPIPSASSDSDVFYASGGYIKGPGSGTSDSIWARVSNGEYVVNALQTAKNFSLLHAINNGAKFAMGGMVGGYSPSIPSFAGGGLVGGGSFGTVNLTIGGQTVGLNVSNQDGFAQLNRIARTEQRTSAGTKPSWYGS